MNILMNKTLLIILCYSAICLTVYSQGKVQPQGAKNDDTKITRVSIEASMKDMSDLIINGYKSVAIKNDSDDSKVLSSLQLKQYEDQYNIFYSFPEIEKMTGYSREWYGKLLKIVQELNKCSSEINIAIIRLHPEKIEILKKKYDELRKIYKDTYQTPEKAKPGK